MDATTRNELLVLISNTQADHEGMFGRSGTAPVTVEIGYVSSSGQVQHDGLIVREAPATVVTAVYEWAAARKASKSASQVFVAVGHGGLTVT